MHQRTSMNLLAVAILASAGVCSTAIAKGKEGGGIQTDGPRIERGERINWEPKGVQREPSPIEKVVRAVSESPVLPAIKDGQPGIQFRMSFP